MNLPDKNIQLNKLSRVSSKFSSYKLQNLNNLQNEMIIIEKSSLLEILESKQYTIQIILFTRKTNYFWIDNVNKNICTYVSLKLHKSNWTEKISTWSFMSSYLITHNFSLMGEDELVG